MLTRANALLVGIGLAALWIAGLATGATSWLVWLDGAAALVSFAIAGAVPEDAPIEGKSIPALIVTVGLFALWTVGLALRATMWLTWLTFVAACAYVVITIAPLRMRHPREV